MTLVAKMRNGGDKNSTKVFRHIGMGFDSEFVRNVIPDCEECYPGLYGMLSRIVRNVIPDCTECYPGLCGMLSRIVRNVIPDCEECYPGL